MLTLTKIILLNGMLFLAICPLFAQSDTLKAPSHKEKAAAMTERMQRELSLSPKQAQQVHQLLDDRFTNLTKADKNNGSLDKVNEQARQKLSAILTKEQFSLYLATRADTKKQKDQHFKKSQSLTTSTLSTEDKELDF